LPCSLGLSATSQQYFSLRTNQPPATSQQYFSLRTIRTISLEQTSHQQPASSNFLSRQTSQTNKPMIRVKKIKLNKRPWSPLAVRPIRLHPPLVNAARLLLPTTHQQLLAPPASAASLHHAIAFPSFTPPLALSNRVQRIFFRGGRRLATSRLLPGSSEVTDQSAPLPCSVSSLASSFTLVHLFLPPLSTSSLFLLCLCVSLFPSLFIHLAFFSKDVHVSFWSSSN
jgi:hypothetical protein